MIRKDRLPGAGRVSPIFPSACKKVIDYGPLWNAICAFACGCASETVVVRLLFKRLSTFVMPVMLLHGLPDPTNVLRGRVGWPIAAQISSNSHRGTSLVQARRSSEYLANAIMGSTPTPVLERNPVIHTLCMTNCHLGAEGIITLATADNLWKGLTSLDISQNRILSGGVEVLAKQGRFDRIISLNIAECGVGRSATRPLPMHSRLWPYDDMDDPMHHSSQGPLLLAASLLNNHVMTSLNISKNDWGAGPMVELVKALLLMPLARLDTSKNNLMEPDEALRLDGVEAVASLISKSRTLQRLDLKDNALHKTGAGYVLRAVLRTISITYLDIGNNNIFGNTGNSTYNRYLVPVEDRALHPPPRVSRCEELFIPVLLALIMRSQEGEPHLHLPALRSLFESSVYAGHPVFLLPFHLTRASPEAFDGGYPLHRLFRDLRYYVETRTTGWFDHQEAELLEASDTRKVDILFSNAMTALLWYPAPVVLRALQDLYPHHGSALKLQQHVATRPPLVMSILDNGISIKGAGMLSVAVKGRGVSLCAEDRPLPQRCPRGDGDLLLMLSESRAPSVSTTNAPLGTKTLLIKMMLDRFPDKDLAPMTDIDLTADALDLSSRPLSLRHALLLAHSVRSGGMSGLRSLDLTGSALCSTGLQSLSLAIAGHATGLQRLVLRHANITACRNGFECDKGMTSLIDALPKLPQLSHLDVGGSPILPNTVAVMAQYLRICGEDGLSTLCGEPRPAGVWRTTFPVSCSSDWGLAQAYLYRHEEVIKEFAFAFADPPPDIGFFRQVAQCKVLQQLSVSFTSCEHNPDIKPSPLSLHPGDAAPTVILASDAVLALLAAKKDTLMTLAIHRPCAERPCEVEGRRLLKRLRYCLMPERSEFMPWLRTLDLSDCFLYMHMKVNAADTAHSSGYISQLNTLVDALVQNPYITELSLARNKVPMVTTHWPTVFHLLVQGMRSLRVLDLSEMQSDGADHRAAAALEDEVTSNSDDIEWSGKDADEWWNGKFHTLEFNGQNNPGNRAEKIDLRGMGLGKNMAELVGWIALQKQKNDEWKQDNPVVSAAEECPSEMRSLDLVVGEFIQPLPSNWSPGFLRGIGTRFLGYLDLSDNPLGGDGIILVLQCLLTESLMHPLPSNSQPDQSSGGFLHDHPLRELYLRNTGIVATTAIAEWLIPFKCLEILDVRNNRHMDSSVEALLGVYRKSPVFKSLTGRSDLEDSSARPATFQSLRHGGEGLGLARVVAAQLVKRPPLSITLAMHTAPFGDERWMSLWANYSKGVVPPSSFSLASCTFIDLSAWVISPASAVLMSEALPLFQALDTLVLGECSPSIMNRGAYSMTVRDSLTSWEGQIASAFLLMCRSLHALQFGGNARVPGGVPELEAALARVTGTTTPEAALLMSISGYQKFHDELRGPPQLEVGTTSLDFRCQLPHADSHMLVTCMQAGIMTTELKWLNLLGNHLEEPIVKQLRDLLRDPDTSLQGLCGEGVDGQLCWEVVGAESDLALLLMDIDQRQDLRHVCVINIDDRGRCIWSSLSSPQVGMRQLEFLHEAFPLYTSDGKTVRPTPARQFFVEYALRSALCPIKLTCDYIEDNARGALPRLVPACQAKNIQLTLCPGWPEEPEEG